MSGARSVRGREAVRLGGGVRGRASRGASRATAAAARLRAWWEGDGTSAALARTALALACVAILAWYFLLSPYGAPASPAYAGF